MLTRFIFQFVILKTRNTEYKIWPSCNTTSECVLVCSFSDYLYSWLRTILIISQPKSSDFRSYNDQPKKNFTQRFGYIIDIDECAYVCAYEYTYHVEKYGHQQYQIQKFIHVNYLLVYIQQRANVNYGFDNYLFIPYWYGVQVNCEY